MTRARQRPPSAGGRREKGSGSISSYATKAGPRWRYEVDVPVDPLRRQDGTRKVSRAGFTSFDDADEALMLLRADVIRKVPQAVGRDTFAGCAQRCWTAKHSHSAAHSRRSRRRHTAMEMHSGDEHPRRTSCRADPHRLHTALLHHPAPHDVRSETHQL